MIKTNLDKGYFKYGLVLTICVTLACLLPFADKAFHIDDPLFIWSARHIQSNPFDFYGFSVNWEGYVKPFSIVMQNPPFTSYYIALIAYLFGWSEIAIHTAFVANTLLVVVGIYFLSNDLCANPLIATLASILTPVFLLAGNNVMSDMLMLSFWVWAVYFWRLGATNEKPVVLIIATFLVSICSLTKYYGISLVPLLFIYSLAERRRVKYWILLLLIPLIVLGAYQWRTHEIYGKGLLMNAASYAVNCRVGGNYTSKVLVCLAFTGGCITTALFYAPFFWGKRLIIGILSGICLFIGLLFLQNNEDINWIRFIHAVILTVSGINILAIAVTDIWQKRNADSLLLLLWVTGTFAFACLINWTISGRNILPMVPAIGVLTIRRLEYRRVLDNHKRILRLILPLALSLFFAISVCLADYEFAETARKAAFFITSKYNNKPGTLWFQGHWGFQYYMEKYGAKSFDIKRSTMSDGDLIVIPPNNCYIYSMQKYRLLPVAKIRFDSFCCLTTTNFSTGAGYYSDGCGPLPYVIGPSPTEDYSIYRYSKQTD